MNSHNVTNTSVFLLLTLCAMTSILGLSLNDLSLELGEMVLDD